MSLVGVLSGVAYLVASKVLVPYMLFVGLRRYVVKHNVKGFCSESFEDYVKISATSSVKYLVAGVTVLWCITFVLPLVALYLYVFHSVHAFLFACDSYYVTLVFIAVRYRCSVIVPFLIYQLVTDMLLICFTCDIVVLAVSQLVSQYVTWILTLRQLVKLYETTCLEPR